MIAFYVEEKQYRREWLLDRELGFFRWHRVLYTRLFGPYNTPGAAVRAARFCQGSADVRGDDTVYTAVSVAAPAFGGG